MPKLVTPVAVRSAQRSALAVVALVPFVLATTPAPAQDAGGVLGLLSRLVPPLPRAAAPAPIPAPPPAPAMIILSPPALADMARPVPAATLPPPQPGAQRQDPAVLPLPQASPPGAQRQASPRGELRRRDASLRRDAPKPRVRPAAVRTAAAPPMPASPKDPGRVENPVPGLLSDRTLRSGDLAMFPDALRVFTGRRGASHGLADFAPLARAGAALPASLRRLAAGLRPGWNRAWSTAGLAVGGRIAEGTAGREAGGGAKIETAALPVQERPAPETTGSLAIQARPAVDPAVRLAAITPAVTVQEAPRAAGPSGPPPRLRGCPGGARGGEDPHLREAFACTPAPAREEAAGPGDAALVQLAHLDGLFGD